MSYASNEISCNLIKNGSFEYPEIPPGGWVVLPSIPRWNLSFGPGIEVQNNVRGAPFDGDNLVELDSYDSSGIYQNVRTSIGGTYLLQFAFSPRPGTSQADNQLRVLWDDQIVDILSASGEDSDTTLWEVHYYLLFAYRNTTRLEFQDIGVSNGVGTYIDDVHLLSYNSYNSYDYCFNLP